MARIISSKSADVYKVNRITRKTRPFLYIAMRVCYNTHVSEEEHDRKFNGEYKDGNTVKQARRATRCGVYLCILTHIPIPRTLA